MVEPTKSILESALQLPDAERAVLVRRLIDSLEGTAPELSEAADEEFVQDAEIEKAWADEVKRRAEAIDRGEDELIPGDEVRRRARKLIDDAMDR
ncbi:MAG: addiction module protein [Planctomycetota bacterium]